MQTKQKNNQALVVEGHIGYRYWQVMFLSFYRLRMYVDVIKNWKGLGWTYLAFLIVCLSVPLSVRIMIDVRDFLETRLIQTMIALPQIEIQKGEVFFDKPMPYLIKNKAGEVVAIVDTTGQTASILTTRYPDLSILITKSAIYYRMPTYHFFDKSDAEHTFLPVTKRSFPDTVNEIWSGQDIAEHGYLSRIRWLSLSVVYPLIVSVMLMMCTVLMLFMGFMERLFGFLCLRVKLTYAQATRLATVSATPALTVVFMMLTFDSHASVSGLVLLLLMSIYFWLAARTYRRIMAIMNGGTGYGLIRTVFEKVSKGIRGTGELSL